jgi:hypothetical protein
MAALVAFMMFLAGDRQGYNGIDIAITYSLFIGGFFLEVCAVFNLMMSPWTWAWLRARGCNLLARFSWYLFSNEVFGWKRTLSSGVMGQYNLRYWLVPSDQPRSFKTHLMTMVKKLVAQVGAEEEKLFWLHKVLFTTSTKVDETMQLLAELTARRADVTRGTGQRRNFGEPSSWHHLEPVVRKAKEVYSNDFGRLIVSAHAVTEEHLSKHWSQVDTESQLVRVCQQLSRYMMYLMVTHPDLLPLTTSAVATLDVWKLPDNWQNLEGFDPPAISETLKEFQDLWIEIFIYAAAMSRPELHAALLARGGEPLTCIWLLLAHVSFHRGRKWTSLLACYRQIDSGNIFREQLGMVSYNQLAVQFIHGYLQCCCLIDPLVAHGAQDPDEHW